MKSMSRMAPEHTYEQGVQAEIANQNLNTPHSIIYGRIDEIETSNPAEAARLLQKSKDIRDFQRLGA